MTKMFLMNVEKNITVPTYSIHFFNYKTFKRVFLNGPNEKAAEKPKVSGELVKKHDYY